MSIKKNFTIIPNSVIWNPNITPGEFRVYTALKSFGYGEHDIFPSQQTLTEKIGLSTRAIRNHLKSLKDKGLIYYKRRGFNKSNTYFFPTDGKETASITGSNLPPNNTINKTINNYYKEDNSKGLRSIGEELERRGYRRNT